MKLIFLILLLYAAVSSLFGHQKCEKDFFKTTFSFNDFTDSNVLLIWFPINAGSTSTLAVCSNETGLPLQRHCSYNRSANVSTWDDFNRNIKLLNCSSIPNTCMEEPFQHNYIMKNGIQKPFNNTWKTAKIKERSDLQEPCLRSSGIPVTRLCEFNPSMRRAQWELLSPDMREISCLKETQEAVVTYGLNHLFKEVKQDREENKVQPKKVVNQMTELLTTAHTVRVPADIKISSEILKIITEDNNNPELVNSVLNVTDIIMDTTSATIVKSEEVNATSSLLNTIDKYLHDVAKVVVPKSHCLNTTDGIVTKTSKQTSVFYINPSCSNISGLAIYNNHSRHRHHQRFDHHTHHHYQFLYLNQTFEEKLSEPDLHLATYFPLSLWEKLKTETGTVNDETVLIFILFKRDALFVNRTRMNQKPLKNILEISIANFTGELPEDVPFIFRYPTGRKGPKQPPVCGYWNYSTWTTTGVKTEYKNISNRNFLMCHTTHLSHFAALFGVSFMTKLSLGDFVILNISHDLMLDYISILGCGLSLLGLSCIWLTAICFRSFRIQSSNKVLLNMCLVLSLLMVFFLLLNLPQLWSSYIDMRNSIHCMIMGAFLHYIVMVLFFWMLIIAIMQYQRYVRVLGYERPSNYIAKFAILAWGLPLIPVGLVAYLDPSTYMPPSNHTSNNTALCYPTGESLTYGVILPIAVIMMANLCIFIYIFYSLRRSLGQFRLQSERKNMITQVRVSVLLFFLLGISWIFGLLSHLDNSPVFSYIFCLTSTLQGFVLFLYSILIDKSTRTSWSVLCCAKSYNTMEDTNHVQSLNSRSKQMKGNNKNY